jgi:ribosomal protein S18 acetylase RimI-like enzyme
VTRFRSFRNTDPPALTRIWNQAVPRSATARPLRVHELSTQAWGSVTFEADGLIVAEREGRIVGFAHAGFGPELPVDPTRPLFLGRELGTIAMLLVEPGADDPEVVGGLLDAAEGYLRRRGAKVLYAGSLFPLNPFFWGIYGGSEGAGILSGHLPFQRGVIDRGYVPVSSIVLLEADLNTPEPRDPRSGLIRRQTHVKFVEDPPPAHWWQGLALGEFPMSEASLLARADGTELARASTWDMRWFDREDGRARVGLINLEVAPEHRRKGYGRFLVTEIFRRARSNLIELVEIQTAAENQPALALYASLGCVAIDQATLYRLPRSSMDIDGSVPAPGKDPNEGGLT